MAADAAEELARVAADAGPVPGVGRAEAAGDQPAQVLARLYEQDGLALARDADRRDHAAGGGAVDDDIGAVVSGAEAGGEDEADNGGPGAHGRSSRADGPARSIMAGVAAGSKEKRAGCHTHPPAASASSRSRGTVCRWSPWT